MDESRLPVGMRFSIISRFYRRQMDELLREHELTGAQLGVLGRLHKLESCCKAEINQRELEGAAHLSHAAMTEILRRLKGKGFIESSSSRIDRRSKCLRTTEKAARFHEEIDRLDGQIFEELCLGLSEEQRAAIVPILDIMLCNVINFSGKRGLE